ncbi:hypothetical protein LSAT2_023552 [Lamellibrachia satsuma]|nr:hypothetical protein LSAT2_023552 [Lamellibrachia satsuma]
MTGKAEAFELGDNDVEEMLNDAEGIMKDAEEILEVFFPSENEEVMSDYEPEKPKKAKEKKKKAKEENVLGKDSRSVKTKSSKRKLNEDGSDKKCKKKKSSTDKPTTGAKEKKKVKSSSSADTPKIKPSFQPPKLEKFLKTKAIKQPAPQPKLDNDVLKMEVSCDVAESLPKKCSETAKKHVTNNDKENANPNAQTKPHMGDSDAPKLVSHEEKIMTKPKVLVKPKFVAPNAHKLSKAKSKDGSTDVVLTKDKDQTNVATKKNKKFSIKKTSAHEKAHEKTHEKANEKTNAKKTKEGAKNVSMDREDTAKTTSEASKDLTEKNSSPRSLDDVTNDLSIDIEDKLFPDLELSLAMDRRPECDGDNDSEPFDMEPVDGAVTDITSTDKLHILVAEYDSDPMEFEE